MLYETLRTEIYQRYTQQAYDEALALIEAHAGAHPDNAGQMLYWRACLEALLARPEASLATLQSMAERSLWVSAGPTRQDDDLGSLVGRPEFEALIAEFERLEAEAQRQSSPRMLTLQPAASTRAPYPLVIAIHGRNDNARNFAEFWRPLTARGWLVALPQSSQILASNLFGWDDRVRAEDELAAHYARLDNDFPLDDTRILLAGFSQGGGLSIWMTLDQRIPATGFLALAPYLHDLDTLETPQSNPTPPRRGVIASGDQDAGQAMFAGFEARLEAAGVPFRRRRYPDLAHELPPDLPDLLDEALEFIYA